MSYKKILDREFRTLNYTKLFSYRDDSSLIQRLDLSAKLQVHNGCVNTIHWSDECPTLILSGSDDKKLSITDAFSGKSKCTIETGHQSNIFSAKFLHKSNNQLIISCDSGGCIQLSNINDTLINNNKNRFFCHGEKTVFGLRTNVQHPFNFYSCGQDGTCKFYDIRQSTKCNKQSCKEHTLIKQSTGITAIAINPLIPNHIVCAGSDGLVRFYDNRILSVGSFDIKKQTEIALFACLDLIDQDDMPMICNQGANSLSKTYNKQIITSVQYDNCGNDVIVSVQPEKIYLLDWRNLTYENKNDIVKNQNSTISQSNTSPNNREQKFRIQSDWSDTGPNSSLFEEIDYLDHRSILMRRLNHLFSNIGQNRQPRSTLIETNENQNQPLKSYINDANDSTLNSGQENNNSLQKNEKENETKVDDQKTSPNRLDSFSKATNLIGSIIHSKKEMKFETNLIKNKLSPKIKMVYTGHRNARTIIKECNFWGNDYIISGSDCGHIFFWNKHTGEIVNILEADKHVVNSVQENPIYPVLASSGIDHNVKIWQPILEASCNINSKIDSIINHNKLMINENRNTIFIPLKFIMPLLRMAENESGTNASNTRERRGDDEHV